MEKKLFNNKKVILVAMSSLMLLTSVIPPISAHASTLDSDITSSIVQDENGEEVILEQSVQDGIHSSIVKNKNGEEISSFILDTNERTAYLDGELLSATQIAELMALVEGLDIDIDSTNLRNFQVQDNLSRSSSSQSVSVWYYSGANEGSLWLAQVGVVAAAGILSSLIPGLGWTVALNIAGALVGQAGAPYYRMKIYYGYTPGYIHVRRDVAFFKDSSKTTVLYGPITTYQKKSDKY